jgi:soluble lytic murein transglycosylase-like protein
VAFFSGLFAGARRYDPASRDVGDARATELEARLRQLRDEYERVLNWGPPAGTRSDSGTPADPVGIDPPPGMMFASSGHSRAAQVRRPDRTPQGRQQSRSARDDVRGQAELGVEFQPEPPVVHEITGPALKEASILAQSVARIPPGGDGRIGNSFTDPDYLPIEEDLERKLKLPAGILAAIRIRGERSNADRISPDGARTVYQIIPETQRQFSRRYGVDGWSGPAEAARVAALNLLESYQRHGDWNLAILEYHGGTNRRNWRQRTRAYGQRVGDFNRR